MLYTRNARPRPSWWETSLQCSHIKDHQRVICTKRQKTSDHVWLQWVYPRCAIQQLRVTEGSGSRVSGVLSGFSHLASLIFLDALQDPEMIPPSTAVYGREFGGTGLGMCSAPRWCNDDKCPFKLCICTYALMQSYAPLRIHMLRTKPHHLSDRKCTIM